MKALKIVGLVVLVAIIVFLVLAYVGSRNNRAQINNLSQDCTEKITENEAGINTNAALIDANTVLIDQNTSLVNAIAVAVETNKNSIQKNSESIKSNHSTIRENAQNIEKLSEAHKELQKIVWAHGRKVNRVVWELVFKVAYGDTKKSRVKWNQYCECTNIPLWKDAVSRLTAEEAKRILNIEKMENETQKIKSQISKIKPKCFR